MKKEEYRTKAKLPKKTETFYMCELSYQRKQAWSIKDEI